MMRNLFCLFNLLIFNLVFCQINIDEIKKNVSENPQKYYYDNLEIYKTTPEKLTQEQLNYIYYGNNYVDYGYKRIEFNNQLNKVTNFCSKKLSKKLANKVLEDALSLYQQNPINKELIYDLINIYKTLGDNTKSDFHALQYKLLRETIQKSGTGKLEEFPIVVTNFSDERIALEDFSTVFKYGTDFKSKVLPDGSWLNIFRNGLDLFFVKTVHHKDRFKND
ncbi:DUF4919 domain-containing protein [Epilithonimonas sp.]|uniref:DUF4919 domain-containing protein n=1 Tax=Epilithonimonas sp. TaxID=2894511 RepID=UPI00289D2264|nr:DUF4919 domain-containing protein [Epilithonimonas sp.]